MIKRIFDIFFSFLALILLLPLLIALSLIIKVSSNGPVFFLQERVGRRKKIFKIIKFRTMYVDAISRSTISVKNDCRVTKAGAFLRKYKLDELPELINVLIGEMSIVGPRPDVVGYADQLVGESSNILELRPGITGPASLKYSNEEGILSERDDPKTYNDKIIYPDKVKINLDYYYNHNIWIDIKIIFATIFKVYY